MKLNLLTHGSQFGRQASVILALWMGFIVCLRGDAIIDFRNFIEGVLDAPVYDVDGVTKLAGNQFFASLAVGPDNDGRPTVEGSLSPVGVPAQFQTGTNAGYWSGPKTVTVPGVTAGERIWAQIRVYEFAPGPWPAWPEPPPPVLWGKSKVFPIVLQDSPTPLLGLEPFSLGPQMFRFERQGSEVIVRWLEQLNATYSLQSTTDLTAEGSWNELWRGRGSYSRGGSLSVTNAIAGERRFFRLNMWR